MDAVVQFFIERWPTLTIAVAVLVAVVWLAVRITKKLTTASVKSSLLEEKCKNMPCEEHSAKIEGHKDIMERMDKRVERVENRLERVENRLEAVGNIVQGIRVDLVSLQTFLQSKYKTTTPLFSQKHSPRTLNEKGREVFAQFGGKEFLDANEEMLCQRIESKKPKTALDVEQDALRVLYETMELDIFNSVKLRVYNSEDIDVEREGKVEKYSISMEDVCFIFSLDLRDRYLRRHPEVPVGEED